MLDDQREFFSPDDLLEAGLPDFLVKRMQLELVRNLQDSVTPPQSDWADMSTEAVRKAWSRFLDAIHEEIRLPASFSAPVIESSLADILDLMVKPRAFLPEYLFGSESKLDLPAIRERCEWVVVYGYFASALPRFMEKKGRATLTKEQADRIIERLDERVTSHYTSLNWAQLFEPWFQLLGEKVEPGLFAEFFRDKGKPGVARLFDAESDELNRSRLIEILSKPQLDEIDDEFEEVGADLLGGSAAVIDLPDQEPEPEPKMEAGSPAAGSKPQSKPEPEQEPEQEFEPEQEPELEPEEEPELEPEPAAARKSLETEPKQETVADEELVAEPESTSRPDSQPDVGQKARRKDKEEKPVEGPADEDDDDNLIDHYKKTNGGDKHDPPLISFLKKEPEEGEDDTIPLYSQIKVEPDEEDDVDVPIWQQFTKEDEEEGEPEGRVEEDEAIELDAGAPDDEDDVIGDDEPEPTAVSPEEVEKIRSYVKDMEEEFVSELFGGDEGAYVESIEHISRLTNWKEAGSYISREVFDRNLIDIYSDTAIYFTDRMQTYFLERE